MLIQSTLSFQHYIYILRRAYDDGRGREYALSYTQALVKMSRSSLISAVRDDHDGRRENWIFPYLTIRRRIMLHNMTSRRVFFDFQSCLF